MVEAFIKQHIKKPNILASNCKSDEHKYVLSKDIANYDFIQFNAHAVSSISIDVDDCGLFALMERLADLPTPSMVVETDSGFHVHYTLAYPISYSRNTLITWARHIRDTLVDRIGGDVNASGMKRLYRNPMTHSTIYNEVSYQLADFGISYPEQERKKYNSKKPIMTYDFANVERGTRHTSMFNYLRTSAYSYGNRSDIESIIRFLGEEANAQMKEPLSEKHLTSLVTNITKFMGTYDGKRNQTDINRRLARAKQEKVLKMLFDTLKELSLKKVKLMSNRAISRAAGVAPSTVGVHKLKILELLTNMCISNIKMSLEHYKSLGGSMTYLFKCSDENCVDKDKAIQADIALKNYDEEMKKLKCETCGGRMRRSYTSPGVQTFGDGYKPSV